MSTRDVVLREALLLPPEDRAMLVVALEESLEHGEFATPEIAARGLKRSTAALLRINEAKRKLSRSIKRWITSGTRWRNSVRVRPRREHLPVARSGGRSELRRAVVRKTVSRPRQ